MTLRILVISALLLAMSLNPLSAAQLPEAAALPYTIQHHDLTLTLDPAKHTLAATDVLTLKPVPKAKGKFELLLRKGLKVTGAWWDDKPVEFTINEKALPSHFEAISDTESASYYDLAQVIVIHVPGKLSRKDQFSLKLVYEGVVQDSLEGADFSREYVTEQITGIIDSMGVYLGGEGIFYPALPNQLFTFKLDVTVPEELRTMSEGSLAANDVKNGKRSERWECAFPVDGFQVIAGNYQVNTLDHDGISISTYFYPDSTDPEGALSKKYLQMSAMYFDLYDSLLGKYPFDKFSIVENFFATGYGMPTFTLLGSEVLRLPFIPYTSLGHEICHNWWGNSVYVDYQSGNWCEGLTTYCADYLYKERKSSGDAREYRMGIDQDYTAYTHKANDFPLTDFRSRHNPAQRAVGYGKSAMAYHILRRQIGEEHFWKGLQRFYKDNQYKFASWAEVRRAFEHETVSDLGAFFDQWVKRTGAPQLAVKSPALVGKGNRWQVAFTLEQTQSDETYELIVPVKLLGESQDTTINVPMRGRKHEILIETGFKPLGLSVDPNFDLFRRLDPAEVAPSLAEVLGAPELRIIVPTNVSPDLHKAYSDLADQLNRQGQYRLLKDSEVKPEDLNGKALFFLGSPGENTAIPIDWPRDERWGLHPNGYRLLNQNYSDPKTALLVVTRHPKAGDIPVGWFAAGTPQDVMEAGRKLMHYGKYSYLVFVGGKNQVKGAWEITQSPLMVKF